MYKTLTALAATGICIHAAASEALVYAGVYECNAVEINQKMVQFCSKQFPQLGERADAAFRSWMIRNSEKAAVQQLGCKSQGVAYDKDVRAESYAKKRESFQELMQKHSNEILENFAQRAEKEGVTACISAIDQLGTGTGAMDFK